jgi:hypothetical protein
MEDGTTAWTYTFDAKRPVADNRPVYVVKAMSELLDAELSKAFEDLDKKMSNLSVPSQAAQPFAQSSETFSDISEQSEQTDDLSLEDLSADTPRASLKNKPQNADK